MFLEQLDEIVIATHNQGKLVEIDAILRPFLPQVTIMSAGALDLPEPEEDGNSFAENAAIKSRTAAQLSGKYALADDSGLEVDALGGDPGIYSARWAGADKDFYAAMKKIRDAVEEKGLEAHGQAARFVCVLALSAPNGDTLHFRGTVEGSLSFPPRGDKGFGYDPIFVPNGHVVTFAEMNPDEKHGMSHRANAFAKLVTYLRSTQQTGDASGQVGNA